MKQKWWTTHTRRSVYIASGLEKVVWFNVDEVGGKVPDVLTVVDNANHMIPTWEERREICRLENHMRIKLKMKEG